jgi:putative endopeptidase
MIKKFLTLFSIAAIFSCSNKQEATAIDPLVLNLDTTLKPGDDFFMYANNGWIKNNQIPDAEPAWGIGNLVQDDIYKRLITINENAVKEGGKQGSITQ